ncbi:putative lanosterol synthase [Apostichopus japonicus]|uniref:Terpene cyclase/mutase family member n=1 Tax=Stichopus japonicus TaxID=307972 RepID=A0A2G8K531_STIJA|nr:putative lanosterol synthase [Apostichopus japonicus]
MVVISQLACGGTNFMINRWQHWPVSGNCGATLSFPSLFHILCTPRPERNILYGKRYYAPEDSLILSLRKELFVEDFETIDWPAQRENIAKIDIYTPHSWLYSMVFGMLDTYEPFHSSWYRESALKVCLDHIKQDDIMTNFISIGPISKMINMLIRWLEDGPDSKAFLQHVDRVYDYIWMGRDGVNMQGTNGTQIWDVSYAAMAMIEAGAGTKPEFQEALRKAYSYLEVSQMVESSPKCVQYYRQYNKGGWPLTTRDHGLIVSDTTAEALKAAMLLEENCPFIGSEVKISRERLHEAVDLLLDMVNPNGGYSSYETLRGGEKLLELLNPSEVFGDIMVDYTYTECTSSVLQALRHFVDYDPKYRTDEIWNVLKNGLGYIKQNQLPDGSFEGSWGVCFTYGTWFALEAFACMGQNYNDNTASMQVKKACSFLVSRQMEDGGWGEKFASCSERRYVQSEKSLVVNTAWALLGLMAIMLSVMVVMDDGVGSVAVNSSVGGGCCVHSVDGGVAVGDDGVTDFYVGVTAIAVDSDGILTKRFYREVSKSYSIDRLMMATGLRRAYAEFLINLVQLDTLHSRIYFQSGPWGGTLSFTPPRPGRSQQKVSPTRTGKRSPIITSVGCGMKKCPSDVVPPPHFLEASYPLNVILGGGGIGGMKGMYD